MGTRRRRFSDEFKQEAVCLAFEGSRSVVEVARELGVRPDQLRKWRKKLQGHETSAPSAAEQENRRLRRELRHTQEERDILKKALAIFSDRRL